MGRFVFISDGPVASQVRGRFPTHDEPLADGASGLAGRLRAVPQADRCFSSPDLRSIETARLVGLAPILDERLRESAFGAWAGRDFGDVETGWPGQLQLWVENVDFRPPGGESFADVASRVGDWIRSVEDASGTTVVVAPASVIRVAIGVMLRLPELQLAQGFDIEPFGRAVLTSDGRRWKLRLER